MDRDLVRVIDMEWLEWSDHVLDAYLSACLSVCIYHVQAPEFRLIHYCRAISIVGFASRAQHDCCCC